METAVGLTWLSRIAVVTVVLALAFFFQYAFENHWIGETGRVLLGMACGAAAVLAGERLWRGDQRTYAQSLSAAGIAFFYLSLWAAFALYHLIPQPLAFAAMLLVTAAAGALALRYDAPTVALLGLAGGYATPLLLGSAGSSWFVLAYALLLSAGASWAARARHWPGPEVLAVAGSAMLYLRQPPAHANVFFVAAYYALFVASSQVAVMAAAQVLAPVAAAALWAPDLTGLAIACLFAAVGLVMAGRTGLAAAVSSSLAGFWLAYGLWSFSTTDTVPACWILTLAFLMFLAWPIWRVRSQSLPLRLQDLLVMALNAGLYFAAMYSLLQTRFGAWEGLLAIAVAAAQIAAAAMLWRRDVRGRMLSAGLAAALLVLAAPVQFAGYTVTVAWALEGAAIAWIGTRFRDKRAVTAALLVLALALARLALGLMYPSPPEYALLANPRFVSFAVTALAMWATAWWIRQGPEALASYIAGHVVMLWGLGLEAVAWASRTADPQNFRSVSSTSLSVLAAFYALLLVAGGAAGRSPVTRILGVGLIGLVVLKLYLYDVWLLGQFYRMAAFAILGVLLLAVSYLYSRRRAV